MIAIFYSLLYPIPSVFSVIALLGIEYIKSPLWSLGKFVIWEHGVSG